MLLRILNSIRTFVLPNIPELEAKWGYGHRAQLLVVCLKWKTAPYALLEIQMPMRLKHGSTQLDSGVQVGHSVIDVFEQTALSTLIVEYLDGKTNFARKGFYLWLCK